MIRCAEKAKRRLFEIARKIEKISPQEDYIQTVWGRGYILKDLPVLQYMNN